MKPNHHLADATLMSYAAGTLSENFNIVIASHLSVCSSCRERYVLLEDLGGVSLDNMAPVSMSSDMLAKTLAAIESGDDFGDITLKAAPARPAPLDNGIPGPLQRYLPKHLDDVPWKTMAPGIRYHELLTDSDGDGCLRLLKISPGVTIPDHGHGGMELTMVLKGAFSDEIGRFKPGDIADLDGDVEHQPIADTHEDCICLAATENPLKFKALMPRLVQYFTGM